MGSSAPLIGLALQGIGTFAGGGGTSYSPDPRAKYEADLAALARSQENALKQRALLNEQMGVSNQLADYQYTAEQYQLQNEYELAKSNMNNQYQAQMYAVEMAKMNQTMQDMQNKAASTLNRLGTDYESSIAVRNLQQQQALQGLAYNTGEATRNLQRNDAQAKFGIDQYQNQLQREQLNLQDVGTDMKEIDYRSKLTDIDRQQVEYDVAENQKRREIGLASASANIQEQQQIGQAELGRQQRMVELARQFSRNEDEVNQWMSRLQGMGLNTGVQGGQLLNDLNNTDELFAAQQLGQAQYGQQLGDAAIQNYMAQGGLDLARQQIGQQRQLANAGFDAGRGDVNRAIAGLGLDRSATNLQRRGVDLSDASNQYELGSFINSLGLQGQQDALQNVLIPDLNTRTGTNDIRLKQALANAGYDVTDYLNQLQSDVATNDLAYQAVGVLNQLTGGQQILDADLARQKQASESGYRSQLANNQSTLAAALAALSSQQYGVLSGIGAGLSSPYPSGGGGGINWGALGDLAQGAIGVFGNRSNSGVLSNYKLNPGGQGYGAGYQGTTQWSQPPSYDNIGIYNPPKAPQSQTYNTPNFGNPSSRGGVARF